MQIEMLDERLSSAWDDFIAGHEGGMLYHSLRYRDLLVKLLGCVPTYLVARDDDRVIGCLPIMSMEGQFGRVLNSLPYYGSHGGVVAANAAAAAALWQEYRRLATAPGVAAATVILNPLLAEPEGISGDFIDERCGFMTPLDEATAPEGALLERIDGSARRNIRKAEALGIETFVDNDRLPFLETVHRDNMAAMGALAKTSRFFTAVPQLFRAGADYDVYVARLGRELVAGLLVFYFNRTVEYFVPAVRHENRSDQPLAAILRHALGDAARRGFTRWNWGGCWPSQISLQRFKRKWGGIERHYRYYVTLNDRALLGATADELAVAYPGFYVLPYRALSTAA